MAASILTQDILAICLLLANGKVDLSVEEVIGRVENYQALNDRHFGISTADFRNLFRTLISWELELKGFDEKLDDVKFSHIIGYILNYHYAHFNDEGEHWCKADCISNENHYSRTDEYWYGYDRKQYQEKRMIKQEMEHFFQRHEITAFHPESVREFMEKMKITDAMLLHCSRNGESS